MDPLNIFWHVQQSGQLPFWQKDAAMIYLHDVKILLMETLTYCGVFVPGLEVNFCAIVKVVAIRSPSNCNLIS